MDCAKTDNYTLVFKKRSIFLHTDNNNVSWCNASFPNFCFAFFRNMWSTCHCVSAGDSDRQLTGHLFCCDLDCCLYHNWYVGLLLWASGIVTRVMPLTPHPLVHGTHIADTPLRPECPHSHTYGRDFTSSWPIRQLLCCIIVTATVLPISFLKQRECPPLCLFSRSKLSF